MDDGVAFDLYELMALEATLSPSEVSGGDGKSLLPSSVPSKDLCLKIGSALVQAREAGGAVDLTLSEPECWILRERVSIFTSIGQRHDLGMAIKMKLYHLLLEYAFAREVGDNLHTVEGREISGSNLQKGIAEWEGRQKKNVPPKGGGDG